MSSIAPPYHEPLQLTTPLSLHQTLTSFLTVAVHTILYTRALYPPTTFLTTRAYNFPVHQSRHPAVCEWINSAIASIAVLLQKGSVKKIVVPVFSEEGEVMERFMFDVERFPVVGEKERWTEFEARDQAPNHDPAEKLRAGVRRADIEEQLRGTIRRLDYACSKLTPLPENCTYSIAVELRDEPEVEPPIGHPQPWIPSEPSLQTGERGESESIGKDVGGVRSVPVRLVEAGEFVLEAWIEEGRAKFGED
ncbi:related to MUS-26 protein MUS-26, involved in DNA repair [Rhynchosporium agropyri]|uniref:Related to MUS-26 protein MUS-26, involved in DNA repair n=1 Tax=Rhynchosporium agropyri TaxID=914238 RepID=A0A1E1KHW0_9HELO|nr:related to MUS-26 protein MUS-26, involved in DNA repair [Rhynchosporium agropyri]